MNPFTIRRATVADAAALARLAADTFTETFAKDNTAEDLAAHLQRAYGVEQQTAEIQDPDVVTLLGLQGSTLVGYAQVRRGPAPAGVVAERPVELQRLYVARPAHGAGLAAALMAQARDAARGFGGTHLWLGVWERNPRAIAFYQKHGFVEVGSHVFMVGSDPQRDLLMLAPLAPSTGGAAVGYSGTPLPQKLGLKAPMRVVALDPPSAYEAIIGTWPEGVSLAHEVDRHTDLVHVFATQRTALAGHLAKLRDTLGDEAAVWVSWPKKAAKVATDITEDTIRELALPLGFVDIKVCAVTEVWSGLKLVVRKELRGRRGP